MFFFSHSVGAGEVLHFAGAAAAEKGRLGLAALRAAGEGQPGPHTAGEHTDAQQSCHCLHQPGSQVINRFSCTFAAALLLFSTAPRALQQLAWWSGALLVNLAILSLFFSVAWKYVVKVALHRRAEMSRDTLAFLTNKFIFKWQN